MAARGSLGGSVTTGAVEWRWRPDEVGAIEFEGRLLLVPPSRRALLVLNDTGRLVWEALAAGLAPAAVGDVLADTFGIGRGRAQRDVAAIIGQWREAGVRGAEAESAVETIETNLPPAVHPVRWRTYAPCGRTIRLEFGDRSLERALHPLLAPVATTDQEPQSVIRLAACPDGGYSIALAGRSTTSRPALEDVVGVVVNHLIDLSYPDARWLAILHAGALAANSRAILVPGASGAGKSTLTAALVDAGWAYLGDDVVPLADTGRVMPLPLALCLKQDGWALLGDRLSTLRRTETSIWGGLPRRYLDLAPLSAPPTRDGFPIGAMIFPRYVPNARLVTQELPPFGALERLIEARAWLSLEAEDVARLFELLVTTKAVELTYGALDDAVRFVHQHVSA